MTVRDLVEHTYSLEGMEIVVRENGGGKWIQGFRISKKAELYPCDVRIENREKHPWINEDERLRHGVKLPIGEIVEVSMAYNNMPTKVMCIDPKKAPKKILDLEVKDYLPRNMPTVHGQQLFNNDFSLEINCYPPDMQEKIADFREINEISPQLEGQMSIEEFLGK